MIKIGLTGSIGMGKSETAKMFAELGIPVFDADQIVHQLYAKNGKAVMPVGAVFPAAIEDGAINREVLVQAVLNDPAAIKRLEEIVHPLVHSAEQDFLTNAEQEHESIVVLDIPLLFETAKLDRVDKIIVVSAPLEIQTERVLARPGMTEEKFQAILSRQIPDAEKRAKADFVVDTDKGLDDAFTQVKAIVDKIRSIQN
jgi:dephospho-CoA kinase